MREPILAGLLAASAAVAWATSPGATVTLGPETLLGGIAVLVLGQGLARDLAEIRRRRRTPAVGSTGSKELPELPRWELNLCFESTLGSLLLVLAGLALVFPVAISWTIGRAPLLAGAGALLLAGWATRDWVLTVRKVRDHTGLPVWRRNP